MRFLFLSLILIPIYSFAAPYTTYETSATYKQYGWYNKNNSSSESQYAAAVSLCHEPNTECTYIQHSNPDIYYDLITRYHCPASLSNQPDFELKTMLPSNNGYTCIYWEENACSSLEGQTALTHNIGPTNIASACINSCRATGMMKIIPAVPTGYRSVWEYEYNGEKCDGNNVPEDNDPQSSSASSSSSSSSTSSSTSSDDDDDGGSSSSASSSSGGSSSNSSSSAVGGSSSAGSSSAGSSSSEPDGSGSSSSDSSSSSSSSSSGGDCDPEKEECSDTGTGGDCDPEKEECSDTGTGGDCDPEKEECSDTGSGNCSKEEKSPPDCTGDAIQCAISESTWLTQCEQLLWQEDLKGDDDYNQGDSLLDDSDANEKNAIQTHEYDHSGVFNPDASGFLGGGSCPQPHVVIIKGQSIEFDFQPFCDLAALIRPLLIALGYFIGALLFLRTYMGS